MRQAKPLAKDRQISGFNRIIQQVSIMDMRVRDRLLRNGNSRHNMKVRRRLDHLANPIRLRLQMQAGPTITSNPDLMPKALLSSRAHRASSIVLVSEV